MALRLTLGAILSSFVFNMMSYVNSFYTFGAYLAIIGSCCVSLIPSRINESLESAEKLDSGDVTYFNILSSRRTLGSILVYVLGMTLSLVFKPVISIRLVEMGMQYSKTGLAFSL